MQVEVYRNLNTGGWTVRAKGGNVLGDATAVLARSCTARYIEGERKRMHQRGRRTVHAVVLCEVEALVGWEPRAKGDAAAQVELAALARDVIRNDGARRVTYRPQAPHHWTTFRFEGGGEWQAAPVGWFDSECRFWVE